MPEVYFSLGSNLGDRYTNLKHCKQMLCVQYGQIVKESQLYETEAWGFDSNDFFLNQVISYYIDENPDIILKSIQRIEIDMGRKTRKNTTYESRIIDIDLLLYNTLLLETPDLIIPHPRIKERLFILEALNEIAPDFIHPGYNKTIKSLHAICPDKHKVMKYNLSE